MGGVPPPCAGDADLPAAQRRQLRDLRWSEEVLQPHQQCEVRALDLALEGHDLVGALQDLRFVDGRLLQELGHAASLLLHVPLQVEELRLRLAHLALDRRRLRVGEGDLLRVRHHELGRDEVLRDRIVGLLCERCGWEKKEEKPFHRETPVDGMRRRKSVGGCQAAMAWAAARLAGVKGAWWRRAARTTMAMRSRTTMAAAGRRQPGWRHAGVTSANGGIAH